MKKLMVALFVVVLMSLSFATAAPAGSWEFNWTKLDTAIVTDLAGYRLYLVPQGQPVVIGGGGHFWQSSNNDPALPITLTNIPEGVWDSAVTAFDLTGNESAPTPVCLVTIDDAPPTPDGLSCQPSP